MLINKIKLNGFKNIYNTTIELQDIVSLLSFNNYGKSNFIEGVNFGIEFIKLSSKQKHFLMTNKNYISINKHTANENFYFEIEFENKNSIINYSYSFEWIKEKKQGAKIVGESLKIKNKNDEKFTTFIKRDSEETGYYKPSESGRADKEIKTDEKELIVNKLIHFDSIYYLEIIKEINNLEYKKISLFDTNDSFDFMPFELDDDIGSIDLFYAKNISKIIHNLKEKKKDKYELLIQSLKSLIPSIELIEPISIDLKSDKKFSDKNIPFKISEKIYRIMVKEKYNNQAVDFNNLSTGTKRIFILLTILILGEIKNIPLIGFEELENGIHPSLFDKLLQVITNLGNEVILLI